MFRHILLATDGSPASLRAAALAGALVSASPVAAVTVFHVVPVPRHLLPEWPLGQRLTQLVRSEAQPIIAAATAALGLPPARVHAEVQTGNPGEEILAIAADTGCDLIILGRQGESAMPAVPVGSVAQRVTQQATCPVALVP